jgi:hypothetical protein
VRFRWSEKKTKSCEAEKVPFGWIFGHRGDQNFRLAIQLSQQQQHFKPMRKHNLSPKPFLNIPLEKISKGTFAFQCCASTLKNSSIQIIFRKLAFDEVQFFGSV